MKLFLVLFNILIQLFSAIVLQLTLNLRGVMFYLMIGVVIFLNGMRFLSWGWLNRRFALSEIYPLTALFFPVLYVYSIISKEAILEVGKIIGVVLIFIGAAIINKASERI